MRSRIVLAISLSLFKLKPMGMDTSSSPLQSFPPGRLAAARFYRFGTGDDSQDPARRAPRSDQPTASHEDLPYKVELWNESRTSVEQILAITANGSIGYAAYYAATREYPERYVTLRHKNNIVSRSNPPQH
jgi:hypothetical protein